MADSRGDARGKSRGTATGDKPESRNPRGRKRQTDASSEQSASASTTMPANVGALLRLCERVLPQEVCAAASCGSHRLPSLAAISDLYRDHLREKHVTARDALPLPRNALPMSRQGEAHGVACRHQSAFFLGISAERAAMEVLLRKYVGTLLDEKTIGDILEKVKETSVDWRQKLVEVPSEDEACIDKLKVLRFERVSLTTLSGNLDDRLWKDLCAEPLRVAPERPSQERTSDDTSAGCVTSADVNKICKSWAESPWQTVAELFRLFEESSSGSGDTNEPPIRLWGKLRGLDEHVRKRLNTMGLQYIHLTQMVEREVIGSCVARSVAIENVQKLKAGKGMRKSDNSTGGQAVWTIKDLSRALPSRSNASEAKEEYLERAKKLAERAVQGCGNETCGAGSSCTQDMS